MISNFLLNFLLLSILICITHTSKILFVSPLPGYSHFQLSFQIAKKLSERNHEVTMISAYPQKTTLKNFRDVSVADLADAEHLRDIKNNIFEWNNFGFKETMQAAIQMGTLFTEQTLTHKNVQELLNSNETFDLVVVESFFNDAFLGLAYKYKAPFIILSAGPTGVLNNHLFTNPEPSSYVPNLISDVGDLKNFSDRLQNFIANIGCSIMKELYYLPTQRILFKKYITTDIELDDIMYNASVMFTNSHYSTHSAVPHLPNIIEIGGITVSPPKPLPDDVKQFLDGAKDGVILFALGTTVSSKDLKPEIRKALLQSFSKLKQKILWKFEADLPDLPSNVKIMTWVSQQDVLAHPNVRAFISHGGLLSTTEAVYHGVPIVGIPVMTEQKRNIAAIVRKGYAVSLDLADFTEEKFSWALNEILTNSKYRENIKQGSRLLKDRPLSAADTAVYWVEHIIRNKGAPHLRSAGIDLAWYQLYMIDILAFISVSIIAVTVILFITLKKIASLIFNIFFKTKTLEKKATKTKKNV